MSATALLACLPVLPASADIVQETAVVEAAPAFVAPKISVAAPEAVERGDFTISYYTIIQSPVAGAPGILSAFGGRASACDGCSSFHSGADYAVGSGTTVMAIADGVVTQVGPDASLGVYLKIEHVIDGQTVTSTYAHMQEGSMTLSVGDQVTVGQQVGLVGMTGAATAPHLHFEIRLGGIYATPVNPVPWMAAHVTG